MRKLALAVSILMLSACALLTTPVPTGTSQPAAPTTEPAPTAAIANNNPFGILIGLTTTDRATLVKSLGAAYFRPNQALVIEQWGGGCAECDLALQAGLRLVLTVRANGGGPGNPSSPPKDMAAYQKTLADILAKYPPNVLVVENEESGTNFYTGSSQDYGVELRAACEVAHGKGIKCTNGGLVSGDVALLVWDGYFERGASAQACDFAQRAADSQRARLLCGLKRVDQLPAREKDALSKDKALLQVYKTSGVDYLNFHWYIADTHALEEAAAFLQSAVGLPLISNETGQKDDNPATVTNLLNTMLELKLAYVIWFSGDALDKTANNSDKPTPLVNPDNTLRPTGQAFKAFMQEHFKP